MGTINNIGNILDPTGSGANQIDVQSLLDQAIAADQAPIEALQQQQNTIQNQTSALQSLETDIQSLQTAATALSSSTGAINSFTATSSNPNVLTASADTTAASGTHTITISSLATTSSYYSAAVASSSTTVGTGSFQIAIGSNAPITITVDNTDNTLNGLAAAINQKNAGVTANVINDANGARLAILSNTSGTSGDLIISNNTTGLGFTKAVTGANASLNVDGVPISSTSDTVSGVIPGVTLNLLGAAPSTPVTVSLAPDGNQATTAINTFVSAWNKVIQDLNSEFDVTSSGTGGGPLESDSTVRNAQEQLLAAISYSITGNNGLVNLESIGVNSNNDGTLSVDSATLSNALNNNYGSVQNLLQGASGLATNLGTVLNQLTDPSQGSITLDLQGLSQTSQSLGQQISDMQAQLTTQEQTLTAQFAQVQTALQELPLLQQQITAQLGSLG